MSGLAARCSSLNVFGGLRGHGCFFVFNHGNEKN